MWTGKITWFGLVGTALLALALLPACGDDDDTSNGGDTAGSGAAGATGGSGAAGATGGSGAAGATGGSGAAGATGGSGGGGSGAMDGGFPFSTQCSEEPPTEPVVCDGVTCEDPGATSPFGGTSCVYACCFSQNGTEVCGAKDTTVDYEIACQPPPEPDTRCPDVTAGTGFGTDAGGAGTVYEGCCTPDNECGVISSIRPLCITTSQYLTLPETPQACDAN